MGDFVEVCGEEGEETIELEAEKDGTLFLSTVQSQFPGSTGLKYRHTNGKLRAIKVDVAGEVLQPPSASGWGDRIYIAVKSRGEPGEGNTTTPTQGPGGWARELDQGKEDTCTSYATGNAVCHYLMEQGIDVEQVAFIGGLLQLLRDTKGKWPADLDGLEVKHMMDMKTGKYGNIKVQITKAPQPKKPNKQYTHILVYKLDNGELHSVFMKEIREADNGATLYDCINSWDKDQPFPLVKADKEGNILYEVRASWNPITKDSQSSSKNDSTPSTNMPPDQEDNSASRDSHVKQVLPQSHNDYTGTGQNQMHGNQTIHGDLNYGSQGPQNSYAAGSGSQTNNQHGGQNMISGPGGTMNNNFGPSGGS